MGGIGCRLGCPQANISSKIFYKINDVMLLENIMTYINEIDALKKSPIEFYITNDKQKNDLLFHSDLINRKFYINRIDIKAHLFSVIKQNENLLLIYGDSFLNENVIKQIVEKFLSTCESVGLLINTDSGIDDVEFIIKDGYIEKSFYTKKQLREITQVFLFNKTCCNTIYKLVDKNINRFDIIYKHLIKQKKFHVIECYKNQCVNINEKSDVEKTFLSK